MILKSETPKLGEWANLNSPKINRKYTFTEWKYSTGIMEISNFEINEK